LWQIVAKAATKGSEMALKWHWPWLALLPPKGGGGDFLALPAPSGD